MCLFRLFTAERGAGSQGVGPPGRAWYVAPGASALGLERVPMGMTVRWQGLGLISPATIHGSHHNPAKKGGGASAPT